MKYNSDLGKKQYDAAMKDGNAGKGVHMSGRPHLWDEEIPTHPYADTPCENFVPTPTINAGDESTPGKKALKIGLLVAFIAFMIYAFVAILLENPEVFKLGELTAVKFF